MSKHTIKSEEMICTNDWSGCVSGEKYKIVYYDKTYGHAIEIYKNDILVQNINRIYRLDRQIDSNFISLSKHRHILINDIIG